MPGFMWGLWFLVNLSVMFSSTAVDISSGKICVPNFSMSSSSFRQTMTSLLPMRGLIDSKPMPVGTMICGPM